MVNNTRYSNGLKEIEIQNEINDHFRRTYFHSTNLIHERRNLLSNVKQNRARRGCSGVVCRRFRRRISACCNTALHALFPVGISSRCAYVRDFRDVIDMFNNKLTAFFGGAFICGGNGGT
jgi:hypothetical protein